MIDNHVHIGQFKEVYYDPVQTIQIVMEKCEGLCFSSTTSCDEGIKYTSVEKEIVTTLADIAWPSEIVKPFLWYNPAFAEQGVTVEKAMNNLPYKGIKIHPLAHRWDLTNTKVLNIAHVIFDYAGQHKLPVLIHTGQSGVDAPGTFSQFFPLYPETICILAHCRPLEETIPLINEFPNVYGDTAFMSEEDFVRIALAGLEDRILPGSDFPITNYFRNHYPVNVTSEQISLAAQYASDFAKMTKMHSVKRGCYEVF